MLDIVVKLFVLAQLRAIVTQVERITPQLMRKVYEDELKPVHPMLAALRAGDPEMIIKYSDLTIPDIDKKLLALSAKIDALQSDPELPRYQGNQQAIRLHNLLVSMDCRSDLVEPLIERAFKLHPKLAVRELIPIILEWYGSKKPEPKSIKNKLTVIKVSDWNTLDSDDLRFKFSQCEKGKTIYQHFQDSKLIFNAVSWLKNVS